jgi:hypothetical protein
MKRIFTAIILIFLLSACGTSNYEGTKQEKPNDAAAKEAYKVVHEETKDGLQFSISLNKNHFTTDDEIYIKAKVTNISTEPITYHAGSSGGPQCLIQYPLVRIPNTKYNKNLIIKRTDIAEPIACPEDYLEKELEPNDFFEREIVYIPKIRLGNDEIEVTSGEHVIDVSFADAGISYPITISSDAEEIITSTEAEEIAKKHHEVQEWIKNHTGESISKTENGEYYILWYTGWEKTSKKNYGKLKEGIYQEEKNIYYKDGNWNIVYLSKIGNAPHRIEIKVDAVKGEVTSVQTYER